MSKIKIEGIAGLEDAIAHIAEIPEDVILDMLNAEADIVVKAQKIALDNLALVGTGQLRASIARRRKKSWKDRSLSMDIYPMGTRDNGVENAEVGFIYEFGAPKRGILAFGWMETANDNCADEAVAAAEAVYNSFLDKNNL